LHQKRQCDLKFSTEDLKAAVEGEFLDAGQGTTNKAKGWKMRPVGTIRGSSFEDARLNFKEVRESLEKGTVIFNSAGAHIGDTIAPATLAAVDAMSGYCGGVCTNMYVTRGGATTSAPPHTDKQDVVVIQTQGKKHWRVYSPPDPSLKPHADPFARGKGTDDCPVHLLKESGSELLLDVVLEEGDVLYVPARFPHTTDTIDSGPEETDWSIHLTFGLDTHVWDLDFASLRRFALLRAGADDALLPGDTDTNVNIYAGKINNLSSDLHEWLMSPLPLGLLEVYEGEASDSDKKKAVESLASNVMHLSLAVDPSVDLPLSSWIEAVEKFRESGQKILNKHRDMYLAAMEESERRATEGPLITSGGMSQDKIDRLSLFRVPKFFEAFNEAKSDLRLWASSAVVDDIPEDWPATWPLKVDDQVEADLGGAMFPATVLKVRPDGLFDVKFFDGEVEQGVPRSGIELRTKPKVEAAVLEPAKKLTKKELKRLEKEKKKGKKER